MRRRGSKRLACLTHPTALPFTFRQSDQEAEVFVVRIRSGSGLGGFLGHGMGLTLVDFKRVLKVKLKTL